jgi:hypothetical protein
MSKIQYPAHKYPTMDPNMRQINPAHTLTAYFFKIHNDIIL